MAVPHMLPPSFVWSSFSCEEWDEEGEWNTESSQDCVHGPRTELQVADGIYWFGIYLYFPRSLTPASPCESVSVCTQDESWHSDHIDLQNLIYYSKMSWQNTDKDTTVEIRLVHSTQSFNCHALPSDTSPPPPPLLLLVHIRICPADTDQWQRWCRRWREQQRYWQQEMDFTGSRSVQSPGDRL